MVIILLAAALLPAIALLYYIWRMDIQKESTSWLAKAVLYGVSICFPTAFIELEIGTALFGGEGNPTTLFGTTKQAFFVAAVLMGYYYSVYHFVDRSPKVAVCILLVPVVAHGIYDALAMSGMVNEYIGGIAFFVLIYFCVKMHKFAKTKIVAQIEKDRGFNETTQPNI